MKYTTKFPDYYPTIEHVMNTTYFKNKVDARAALETLYWLENGAPEKFDGLPGIYKFNMNNFIKPPYDFYDSNSCGTACCIAGAIHSFRRKVHNKKVLHAYENIYNLFPIGDDYQLKELFLAEKYINEKNDSKATFKEDEYFDLEDLTVKQAYKALKGYLETGITKWEDE